MDPPVKFQKTMAKDGTISKRQPFTVDEARLVVELRKDNKSWEYEKRHSEVMS